MTVNDNIPDIVQVMRASAQNNYRAGRAGGLKEAIDLVVSFGKSADTQSVMTACVALSQALLTKIHEQPDFPEYMR